MKCRALWQEIYIWVWTFTWLSVPNVFNTLSLSFCLAFKMYNDIVFRWSYFVVLTIDWGIVVYSSSTINSRDEGSNLFIFIFIFLVMSYTCHLFTPSPSSYLLCLPSFRVKYTVSARLGHLDDHQYGTHRWRSHSPWGRPTRLYHPRVPLLAEGQERGLITVSIRGPYNVFLLVFFLRGRGGEGGTMIIQKILWQVITNKNEKQKRRSGGDRGRVGGIFELYYLRCVTWASKRGTGRVCAPPPHPNSSERSITNFLMVTGRGRLALTSYWGIWMRLAQRPQTERPCSQIKL